MPMLSIIVPVYNKAMYIDACINSILSQTFRDFELILINDGSTDGSAEKCDHYKYIDNRVVVVHQENGGVSSARNRALDIAKGIYVGFIDSDDTVEIDFYELLIDNIISSNADISVCGMQVINKNKVSVSPESSSLFVLNHSQALSSYLNEELSMSANNKIYRSSIVKQIRFEGAINEDILFTCKAFIESDTTVVQNTIKYNYIVRDNSTSMSQFNVKYMEVVNVSARIVELVSKQNEDCIARACAYDISANLSILNLLLLIKKREYNDQLKIVANNLKNYSAFIRTSGIVKKKHRYALALYSASPKFYRFLLYCYCLLTDADILDRT